MAFAAKGLKPIRATPSGEAEVLRRAGPGLKLAATGKLSDPDWAEVFLPDDKTTGWVSKVEFSEVPDDQPRPLDQELFLRTCMTVERQINAEASTAPWFVAADFLIARALLETEMTAGSISPGGPIGPLAVTVDEWNEFRASNLDVAETFGDGERKYLLAQTFAAAYAMSTSAKQFSGKRTPSVQPADGPSIPSYLDLFIAYLTNVSSAAILADPDLDQSSTLADKLDAEIVTSLAKRTIFNGIKGSTKISAFLKTASAALASLLDAAFDHMRTLAGDELPRLEDAAPSWLTIARAELERPVSETVNDERIAVYFDAIKFGKIGKPVPHWCGAFVGFCTVTAGQALPKSPGLAASWKTWGDRSFPVAASQIPVGAVVVLKPQDPKTSGHVGFFERFVDGRTIELLGGNQDDQVSKKSFAITEIAAIRTVGAALPIGAGDKFDMTRAGVKAEFQKYGDLIVDRFAAAGFNTRHQLAAVLANAIEESGLNPAAASHPPERSFGLFQCNQKNGVGKGYSEAKLKDPEVNISLIIAEARKSKTFCTAATLEAAVEAFVKWVERPKNTGGAITRRLSTANKLLAPN
ncbi:phage tail tip lysozyme [Rhizobium leguminosarum]|uniref:phage tail tip lysozyme n=1 Tax=Rhizobium leguminosarum TaxID=384 RepID=UPI0014428FE8|nr:phage tail tip lysozyme [Rhizobium leguminosarum]NKK77700.1 hypothetical protein [Rhizobium leguminosarum bv. viciae]